MPRRTTLVFSLVLLVSGAALRYHYLFLEQYALKLLIAVSIVAFGCSVLMSLRKIRSQTYKDSLALAVVVAILCGFTYESAAGNRLKNRKYLERVAGIIGQYIEKNHVTPNSVDDAVESAQVVLENHGDADGYPLQYIKLSDRIYVLRASGPNRRNELGAGDDVEVNYANGKFMSFQELANWIESSGTADEKATLEIYRPALQRVH